MMADDAAAELEKITRLSARLQKSLDSADKDVVKKAEARLNEVSDQLRAWAKRHEVKLVRHTEQDGSAPTVRRRCPMTTWTTRGEKVYICFFMERQGRNCLYECVLNPHRP
jgi:hypothetical protein